MNIQTTVKLNQNIEMPIFGFGVYKSAEDTYQSVRWALESGYRHIDTAAFYENEEAVGQAIRDSKVRREDIFLTTKMWTDDMRNRTQRQAMEQSLKRLKMDYVDMYLLHWPVSETLEETWKLMEEFRKEGKTRAIGVSNCHEQHLRRIFEVAEVTPAVNQVECHPYLQQKELRAFCAEKGIAVQAWSPLGRARLLNDKMLFELAEKYGKTPAQIVLRWDLQEAILTIPKSVHRERIAENADIFDFELSTEDVNKINALDCGMRFGSSPDNFTH